MYNLKNHKNSYIVAAVVLVALIIGGFAYTGKLDFSKLTGAMPPPTNTATTVQGSLGVSVQSVTSDILFAGSTQQLVSRYTFRASNDSVTVKKLTVMNDLSGSFDTPVNTNAVSNVIINYPDVSGITQTRSGTLTNGMVTFSNLNFLISRNASKNFDIYVNVSSMGTIGETLSGKTFRFGIKDTQNTVATFEAVGASTKISTSFAGSSLIKPFAIRKSKPVFASVSVPPVLKNGENTLYGLNITAQNGDVSFGRLVFDITTSGLSYDNEDIRSFHLYRGTTMIQDTNVNIVGTDSNYFNNVDLQTSAIGLGMCDGGNNNGIKDGTYKVLVSFNTEEKVLKDSTQTYYLKATLVNSAPGSSVVTKVTTGDDNVALTSLTAGANANTGKIFVQGGSTRGIFSGGPVDFSLYPIATKGIIWSDRSAATHSYPTFYTVGFQTVMTSDTGSSDWTNGYLLKAGALPVVTLQSLVSY